MNELKTLKEITHYVSGTDFGLNEGSGVPAELRGQIIKEENGFKTYMPEMFTCTGEWVRMELKAEAIKWILHFDNLAKHEIQHSDISRDTDMTLKYIVIPHTKGFITTFFNITEEDLEAARNKCFNEKHNDDKEANRSKYSPSNFR